MGTDEITELREQANEFNRSIYEIKTDVAIIKEKYNHMNEKILNLDKNFIELVSIVENMRKESNDHHKAISKAMIASSATVLASFIGAIAVILSAML